MWLHCGVFVKGGISRLHCMRMWMKTARVRQRRVPLFPRTCMVSPIEQSNEFVSRHGMATGTGPTSRSSYRMIFVLSTDLQIRYNPYCSVILHTFSLLGLLFFKSVTACLYLSVTWNIILYNFIFIMCLQHTHTHTHTYI